jgi:hypothetical protein
MSSSPAPAPPTKQDTLSSGTSTTTMNPSNGTYALNASHANNHNGSNNSHNDSSSSCSLSGSHNKNTQGLSITEHHLPRKASASANQPQPFLPRQPPHRESISLLHTILRQKKVGEAILFRGFILRIYAAQNGHLYLKKIGKAPGFGGKENNSYVAHQEKAKKLEESMLDRLNVAQNLEKEKEVEKLEGNAVGAVHPVNPRHRAQPEPTNQHQTNLEHEHRNNPVPLPPNPVPNAPNMAEGLPPQQEEDLLTLSLKLSFLLMILSNENNMLTTSLMVLISIYILLFHIGFFSALSRILFGQPPAPPSPALQTTASAASTSGINSSSSSSSSTTFVTSWRDSAKSFGIAFLRSLSPAAHSFQ